MLVMLTADRLLIALAVIEPTPLPELARFAPVRDTAVLDERSSVIASTLVLADPNRDTPLNVWDVSEDSSDWSCVNSSS